MLNSLKLYIIGAVGGLFAILFGWLKITQSQRDKAKLEVEKLAQARMAEKAKYKQADDTFKARVNANEEAKQVESEAVKNRGKRPDGNFGDQRLK